MPTGYTAKLYDGDVPFLEFAWGCARAMGAFMSMRDAPRGASIPQFEPSQHNKDCLEEAKRRLVTAQHMGREEAAMRAEAEYDRMVAGKAEYDAHDAARAERYRKMLFEVSAWIPPTPNHSVFKSFMLEQLRESLKYDTGGTYKVSARTGEEWIAHELQKAQSDIDYYTEAHAREIHRCAERNAWVDALRKSLGEPPTKKED